MAAVTKKKPPSKDMLLSFKITGRVLALDQIESEFMLMSQALKKPGNAEIFSRICRLSGTHLLKLNTSRAESLDAVLRFFDPGSNCYSRQLLPSTNAPDIPYAKVIYRPLEIKGEAPKSLVTHILEPDEMSEFVTKAFAKIFGPDCLSAIENSLCNPLPSVQRLPAAEFPIIFLPNPAGGDIQASPVAPASAYMGMRDVIEQFFIDRSNDRKHSTRPKLSRQAISGQPQNISGAIGGPRIRFHAQMPTVVNNFEAQLLRYQKTGVFPRWDDPDIVIWISRYADLLDKEREFSNQDIRMARDRIATRLILDANSFAEEILAETQAAQPEQDLSNPPRPSALLLNRWWPNRGAYDRARRVLTSEEFQRVEQKLLERI